MCKRWTSSDCRRSVGLWEYSRHLSLIKEHFLLCPHCLPLSLTQPGPCSTPVTMEAKLSSSRIMSAAFLAASEPAMPMATPMSAFFRAGESLTPSPVTATIAPCREWVEVGMWSVKGQPRAGPALLSTSISKVAPVAGSSPQSLASAGDSYEQTPSQGGCAAPRPALMGPCPSAACH